MTIDVKQLMQEFPAVPETQVTLANWREPMMSRWSFSHVRQILPTAPFKAAGQVPDLPHDPVDLGSLRFTYDGSTTRLAAGLIPAAPMHFW